jgi:hypothetical protein
MELEHYQRHQRELDQCKSEADRLQGGLDQALLELKKEFGCRDLRQAKALLLEMEEKETAAKKEYEAALARFEKKWSHVLDR